MGATGRESFALAFIGADPQNSRKNIKIGSENDKQGEGEVEASHNKHGGFFVVSVRTSQLNQWWVSTIEVIDFIMATKSKVVSPHGFHETSECPIHVRYYDKGYAYTPGHLATIK